MAHQIKAILCCHHLLLHKSPIQIAPVSILQEHPCLTHVMTAPIYLRPYCPLHKEKKHQLCVGRECSRFKPSGCLHAVGVLLVLKEWAPVQASIRLFQAIMGPVSGLRRI